MVIANVYRRVTPPTSSSIHRSFIHARHISGRESIFRVSEEIREALASAKPVVALETTIYTHGWPYPENVALSSHLESVVRVNGGIPATIGVLDGVARVGMSPEEIIQLLDSRDKQKIWKLSRRDLGFITGLGLNGRKINGGTTIAATMVLAHLAGIRVFATGGLGGVHRGGENTMDISADLTELGRTPVTVISSGCKSFLDIPRTLEYLETQGVGVGTFADGRTGSVDFPAFFSRDSGTKSPQTVQNEAEAAAIVFAQSRLPLQSGLHFANPVPEHAGIPKTEMDSIIAQAVQMADDAGIHGADNTPFILDKIKELSSGRSVAANRALVESNVARGTKVAVELAKLEFREIGVLERAHAVSTTASSTSASDRHSFDVGSGSIEQKLPSVRTQKTDIIVAGSIASDLICDYCPIQGFETTLAPELHTSNPSRISTSLGGVGHNVAYAAHLAGASVMLSSAVADDLAGVSLVSQLEKKGMTSSGITKLPNSDNISTAQYVAVNDAKKDLVLAMADFSILSSPILESSDHWSSMFATQQPAWVAVDGNWSAPILKQIVSSAKRAGKLVAFEPVSMQKASRLLQRASEIIKPSTVFPHHVIDLASPNRLELETMYDLARNDIANGPLFESEAWWNVINQFGLGLAPGGSRDRFMSIVKNRRLVDQGVPQQTIQLLPFIPCLVTKLGSDGVLLTQLLRKDDPKLFDAGHAPYILSHGSETRSGHSESEAVGGVYMRLFPPAELLADGEIVSVNGAGDTMLGVLLAGLVQRSIQDGAARANHLFGIEDVIPTAQKAAILTLKSRDAVSPAISNLRGELSI